MTTYITVARVDDIPEGKGCTVQVGDELVAIFKAEGRFFAINDLCPHMGASLGAGEVIAGVVTCPWHAWRFRVTDGTWCDNPKLKVGCYEVRVVGDELQVRLPDPVAKNPG